jgi:DNA polymerase elongation subunit (family B)
MSKFYTSVIKWGDKLLFRYVNNGQSYKSKVSFQPTLYASSAKATTASEWKTLEGRPVYPMKLESLREGKEYLEKYKDVEGFEFFGNDQFQYQFISQEYSNDIKWDKDLIKIYTIDIETATENGFPEPDLANEEILLITIKDNNHKRLVTFSTRPYENTRTDLKYIQSPDEATMLRAFIYFWMENYPDVITGWNTLGFDIPYLYNRMVKVVGESFAKKISPWEEVLPIKVSIGGQRVVSGNSPEESVNSYNILGIATLDYLKLYKKFTYTNQESYKLDYIAEAELGENKLENPYDNFKDFYTKDWDKFVKYNIHDVELVDKLEDKMKLIDLVFTLAYSAKINYDDVFSPVKMWDMIIYNYLNKRKIAIPLKVRNSKSETFEGAYVKETINGMHKWVASFDLNSLYPHLIMQYNMSPETLTQHRIDTNVTKLLAAEPMTIPVGTTVTANGWCYSKEEKGFLPALMEEMYNNRSKFKKQMLKCEQEYEKTKDPLLLKDISRLKNLQMAMKIALNSAYGAVGNKYFRYYDLRIAEGITLSGQLSIRWMANKLNDFMNRTLKSDKDYVIAIDTDSIYLSLEDLVEKVCAGKSTEEKITFMDKTCEQVIQPFIDGGYQELATYMNAYSQKMQMKREVLADKGIWVAKKRYVLNVHNSEGVQYAKPKIKVMGLEMVKSSTPAVVRKKLKDALEVILYEDEKAVQTFVKTFKKEFFKYSIEDVAFPRSISDIDKYSGVPIYKKGTPIHVRGALLFNHHVKRLGLTKQYEPITNGNKIKFVYIKDQNPFNENIISFNSVLPKEFGLHDFIDYDLQFEKVFLDALQIILEPIGWNTEEKSDLSAFFG